MTDIEIAKKIKLSHIREIAENLNIDEDSLDCYGKYKAKIIGKLHIDNTDKLKHKLILVTATNPTPAGEGKTTTSVGLSMAFNRLGFKSVAALREPSLGPVFGIKGGAAGGGYSQVLPMEDINLHFTGDFHAITSANNLIAALIDNHITQGNTLNIDPTKIIFKRCLDMNDRSLRNVIIGLGGKVNGYPREDKFQISVASEIMACLCLCNDISDLKARIGNILIAYNKNGEPVFAKDINAQGAAAALLKDAIYPNLVQTTENTPAIIHGGPFANIAHGCNSIIATKTAMALSDYAVTEAGFGSDLGAEKFIGIKCRLAGLKPDASVLTTTIRALKYNGGATLKDLNNENMPALEKGFQNLKVHIENLWNFGLPVVVALNKFPVDTDNEIKIVKAFVEKLAASNKNLEFAVSTVWADGGAGGIEIAEKLVKMTENIDETKKQLNFVYDADDNIKDKINKIAKNIYRANDVKYTADAEKAIAETEKLFGSKFPVCVAKTQYSLSDDPKKIGRPENFEITITNGYLCNGAGFFVALAGNVMTMPGLPKVPSAEKIEIDENGDISGLF